MQGGGLGETAQRWRVQLECAQGRHLQRHLLAGFQGRIGYLKALTSTASKRHFGRKAGGIFQATSVLLQSDEKYNFLFFFCFRFGFWAG